MTRFVISTVREVSDTDIVAPFLERHDAETAIDMIESGKIGADDFLWMMLGERSADDMSEDGDDPVVIDLDRSDLEVA